MKNNVNLISALYSIKPSELNYNDWILIGMALKYEGLGLSVWINWNKNNLDNPHPKNYKQKWDSFKGSDNPVTGRTIFSIARKNGWIDYSIQEDCLDWDDEIHYTDGTFFDETDDFFEIEDIDFHCNYGDGEESDADSIDFDCYRTDEMYDCEIAEDRFSMDDVVVYEEELYSEDMFDDEFIEDTSEDFFFSEDFFDVEYVDDYSIDEYVEEDDYPLEASCFCEDDICIESSRYDDTIDDPSMEIIVDYENYAVEDIAVFRDDPPEEDIVWDSYSCYEGDPYDDHGCAETEEYYEELFRDGHSYYEGDPYDDHGYLETEEYYEELFRDDRSCYEGDPYDDHDYSGTEEYNEEFFQDDRSCYKGEPYDDHDDVETEEYQDMVVRDDCIHCEVETGFGFDYVEIDEQKKDSDAEEKKLKAYHDLFAPTDEVKPLKIEEIPDIDPLEFMCIKGLLFMDGTLLLTGASKSGKSFLGLNLLISGATGKDWLGFKCKKGKVLYVDCENGLFQTQKRIKYLLEKFGISKEDYTENLRIYSYCNFKGSLDSFFEKLTKVAGEEYMMIIIDPIYKMLDGDENSSETMNRFIEKITALKASSKAAIVICHHEGKTGNTAKKIIDRSAGSSVLPRHPDAVVSITDLDEKMSCGGKREKIEFQLRCFASPEAIEVCFVDGVHIPLNDDCNKQYLSITNKSKQLAHEDLLISAYKKLEETGRTVVVGELAKEMNVSLNTAKKYIDESEHFAIDAKGVVTYVENQN